MATSRYVWVDWAKVILIYLMVVGHSIPCLWQFNLIYAFHMPAFFVISGFLYHEHNWRHTLKSFGIPLVVFSSVNLAIYLIPKLLKGTLDTSNFALRCFVPYFGGGPKDLDYIILFPGCWFIFSLFFGRLLMGDIHCLSFIRKFAKYAILLLCVYLIVEPFVFPNNPLVDYKFYRVVASLPFMLGGYVLKEILHVERLKWRILFPLMVIFVIISLLQGRCGILGYQFGYSYVVYYINAIIGSICLFALCSKLKSNVIIETLSKGTLFVLAFNFVLIAFCRVLFDKIGFGGDKIVVPWLVGIISMAICYYPINWILKYCPALLGK